MTFQVNTGTETDMKTSETEDPDINPQRYSHLIFDKILSFWRNDSHFNK
jgi:hypothetical protein